MELGESRNRALKPDAQAFDKIIVKTVPRFKDSELSGSEWRIRASVELWRKGKLVHETSFRNIETAAQLMAHTYMSACDNALGFFAGEGDICDQEGCEEKATVTFDIVKQGCGHCGTRDLTLHSQPYRMFCERHKHRGDSSLDDSDDCYKQIA